MDDETLDYERSEKSLFHDIAKFKNNIKAIKTKKIQKGKRTKTVVCKFHQCTKEEQDNIKYINKQLEFTRTELYRKFKDNANKIRTLNRKHIKKANIIGVFDSALTRMLQMQKDEAYEDIIVVKSYYHDLLHNLVVNGFMHNDCKYVCLTASAGQMKTKKTVFIKESLLLDHQGTLMCGLTLDKINTAGGVNVNKYLAYLALCNSATDLWDGFDIDKCIVVDDLETLVNGEVDYIDDKTYAITRQHMDIPITHTDGSGMVLPKISRNNLQVRLPWIKGLLSPFPFDKFIRTANEKKPNINHAIVRDIYGKKHDILEEGIQVIFTKSQFKMWKYYEDDKNEGWQEYIKCFKDNNCTAGFCNEEETNIRWAKSNYQMIQTLTDMTDDEIKTIAKKSIERILNIGTDRDTMISVFGDTDDVSENNYLKQALQIYPELLNDSYTEHVLSQIKKKLVNDAKSAKLNIYGKYTFIIPDLYAFCERLFLGEQNPIGLLQDGEVYCKLFKDSNELDCLRSPQLYREHAIRHNVVDADKSKWFITNGLYTSCHDLISKMLQFDNDGDKSLVCADKTIISVAKRHMKDIVPLYYEMSKAEPVIVDNEQIYQGLYAAYSGGKIGDYSNNITKIWNSENGDLDVIKILCMENNFQIDYSKTLYKPERPKEIDVRIKQHTKSNVPHFFTHAKNKTIDQVEGINNCVVNRLETIIPNNRIFFGANNLGRFNYKKLMSNPKLIDTDDRITITFSNINRCHHLDLKKEDDDDNYGFVYQEIRNEILKINPDPILVTDILVKFLYKDCPTKYKNTLWQCFGDVIVENLKHNIKPNSFMCYECGKRVIRKSNSQKYCEECSSPERNLAKKIQCCDCKQPFEVAAKNNRAKRCDTCQSIYRKEYKATKERERNQKIKLEKMDNAINNRNLENIA